MDVLQLWSRRKWLLLLAGFIGAFLAAGIGMALPPKFKANAQILVDPRDLKVLDNQVTPQAEAQNIGTTLVETQALVLGSERLLREVIRKLDLTRDPAFNGAARGPLALPMDWLKGLTGQKGNQTTVDAEAVVLDALQQALSVYRLDRTYVLESSVTTTDRGKAKKILEALIEAYLAYQSETRSDVAKRASAELGTGIDDLKRKVETLEQDVARYQDSNNLIASRGQSVTEQQLSDVNAQVIKARVEAAQLKARLDSLPRRASDLDKVPEAMASQTLRELRVLMTQANERRARLSSQLLPAHPVMRSLNDSGRQVRTEINRELARIGGAIKIDYERAQQKADEIGERLENLRAQQSAANKASIKLREMQRNLEAARAVYASAIKRVTEANEQMRLSTANIRIISEPHVLNKRVFPPPLPLLIAVGFVLGLIVAFVLFYLTSLMRSVRA